MPSTESYQLLLAAAAACEDKKAEDIRILALDPTESGLTDYFLICNGTNDRQNVAITDEIEIRLKRDFGTYPNSVEGRRQGEWILMDYVDFIVHVFSAEKRAFYGLERLRKSATTISVAELTSELKALIASTRTRTTKPSEAARPVAKKTATKATPARKSAVKPATKKAAAPPARKAVAKKAVAAKAPTTKTPAKKAPAKKAPATKAPAKKTASKAAAKRPARKS
jgi:ribosome-associated protein